MNPDRPKPTLPLGVRWTAFSMLVLALAGSGCRQPVPRNLVLVVIDTLRQDHLGCYGYGRDTAPTLCRLAAEGARLDGISPSSWTKPATASILTGLHPLRLQVVERSDRLPDGALSLAEILSEHGLQTLGLSGNNWIQERFGFEQGFDELNIEPHEIQAPPTAEEMNERLRVRLAALREPYFLYLHYVDPHEPYAPPASWDGSPLDARLVKRGPVSNNQLHLQRFMRRDPQLLRDAVDLYDGEIRFVDTGLSEALAMLDEAGLMEKTLLVVTSDHGEEFEDHHRGGHGLTLHREVTRVPLVFHSPGLIPAGVLPGAAGLVDLVPTILDLMNIDPPDDHRFDGASLVPRMTETVTVSREERGFLLHLDLDSRASLAFVRGPSKLLLSGHPYRKQLYDHASDRAEMDNLFEAPDEAGRFLELSAELAARYNSLMSSALEHTTTQIDEDLARRIRALGYIAPSPNQLYERTLPARIRPADSLQGGLLGWENLGDLEACIETADPEDFDQLLEGWRFVEIQGRWTLEKASVVLPISRAGADHVLSLTGMNFRGESFTLTARVGDREVFRRVVLPGPVRVEEIAPAESLTGSAAIVRLQSIPSFTPAEGDSWEWQLGVFLRSICLTEKGATAGTPAP